MYFFDELLRRNKWEIYAPVHGTALNMASVKSSAKLLGKAFTNEIVTHNDKKNSTKV